VNGASGRTSRPDHLDTDTLVYALRVLRERWWIPVVTVLACSLLALGLSLSRDKLYETTASVLFGGSRVTDSAFGIQRDNGQPERDAATQVLVAQSPEVADRTREELKLPTDRGVLLERVTVSAADNANVLYFTVTDTDPAQAARLANGFAEAYRDFNRESEVSQLAASQRSLEVQLESLPAGADERQALEQRLSTLQSYRAAANGGARVIGRAAVPAVPAAPSPLRDAILGAILGLALGLTVVFLLDLFDRRVKSVDEFERLYEMRTLASIPQLSFDARTRGDRAVGFEPYRVLRNSLGFAELAQRLDVVMVTSAMPAEGKSSVSVNLARAIALSGQRVVLVECDLRRPALAAHLGIEQPGGGLTTALVGRRPVSELLRPVAPGLSHLTLLPSGPLPPNAAELLRSPRMGEVIAELIGDGSRVVIDAPPLLPVADAQGLLDHPQIDAALVVARAFQTTREEVRRARDVLDRHRLQPLGIVVTGLKEESAYGYYGVDPGGVAPGPPERSEGPPVSTPG